MMTVSRLDSKMLDIMESALKYCRLRLLPFHKLSLAEAEGYGLRRSRLHNRIAECLDVDRELVEAAFAKAEAPFGVKVDNGVVVDGIGDTASRFTKAFDAFCDELRRIAALPERERHPDRLSAEDLDRIGAECKGLKGLS